jgi:hypothetical protein
MSDTELMQENLITAKEVIEIMANKQIPASEVVIILMMLISSVISSLKGELVKELEILETVYRGAKLAVLENHKDER